MTEWSKTLGFVVAAFVTIGVVVAVEHMSRPIELKEYEQVGELFYPDFEDPLAVKALEVKAYNADTATIQNFQVNWTKNGWTISPYGYPADAESHLEQIASSTIGVRREGFATRRKSDHARFGVVDPGSEDVAELTGRGKRLILKDGTDKVLVDLIIGNAVENRQGYFYVRKAKENDVYISRIQVDLSTRFADWIQDDLLDIASADLRGIDIQYYSVDEDRGRALMEGQSELSRPDGSTPWELEGLKAETEQINTTAVNGLTQLLESLAIIGVRPKPKGLTADLKVDQNIVKNELELAVLREDLVNRGFFISAGADGKPQLIGKEGQLTLATTQGIAYDIYFGEQFSGSTSQLEFGTAGASSARTLSERGAEPKAEQKETGRYVFIAARFDAALLGPAPAPPAEGEPTAEDEQGTEGDKESNDAQSKFEQEKAAYDSKVEAGKKQAETLNERFGQWYYVLSTADFEKLKLSRDELVGPKDEKPANAEGSGGATAPMMMEPAAPEQTGNEEDAPMPEADEPSADGEMPSENKQGDAPASDAESGSDKGDSTDLNGAAVTAPKPAT